MKSVSTSRQVHVYSPCVRLRRSGIGISHYPSIFSAPCQRIRPISASASASSADVPSSSSSENNDLPTDSFTARATTLLTTTSSTLLGPINYILQSPALLAARRRASLRLASEQDPSNAEKLVLYLDELARQRRFRDVIDACRSNTANSSSKGDVRIAYLYLGAMYETGELGKLVRTSLSDREASSSMRNVVDETSGAAAKEAAVTSAMMSEAMMEEQGQGGKKRRKKKKKWDEERGNEGGVVASVPSTSPSPSPSPSPSLPVVTALNEPNSFSDLLRQLVSQSSPSTPTPTSHPTTSPSSPTTPRSRATLEPPGTSTSRPLHIQMPLPPPNRLLTLGQTILTWSAVFFTVQLALWAHGTFRSIRISTNYGSGPSNSSSSTSLGFPSSSSSSRDAFGGSGASWGGTSVSGASSSSSSSSFPPFPMNGAGLGSNNNNNNNSMNEFSPKEYDASITPETSKKKFSDVKGVDEAKVELEDIVQYLRDPTRFTKFGGKLPKGVLLAGPPGTGKTLLAKAVAGEANVPFFYRSGSEFEEMYVGVGAKRMRQLFQAAKRAGKGIIFIDEIDAIGGNRQSSTERHNRMTLNQLLTEMDGFEENSGIVVMAATNIPDVLDPALVRPGRFDRTVHLPLPDVRGREEILKLYMEGKLMDVHVQASHLARVTPGFSGAELAAMMNEAAIAAAKHDASCITLPLIEEARDKILMGSANRSASLSRTRAELALTAHHEAGHALVAALTPGASPIHKATIIMRGGALGMVSQLPSSEYQRTKEQMVAFMDVCMGGRIAEELMFGPSQVTSGATNDLKQATTTARHMVMDCGMSDVLGPVDVKSLARGQETEEAVDREVTRLLRESHERVKKLLEENRGTLEKLANELLERETMDREEIERVVRGEVGGDASLTPPTTPSTPSTTPSSSTTTTVSSAEKTR